MQEAFPFSNHNNKENFFNLINKQGTVFVTKKFWKNKCGTDNSSLFGVTMLKDLRKNLTLNNGIASYEIVVPDDANAIFLALDMITT